MKATNERSKRMQEVRLLRGKHPSAFDADGNATMCGEEYVAWAAGEPHSDWPDCASHVLKFFTRSFNDALDDEQRQRLRPYLVPQIGTAGDGQDGARRFLAADWIIRAHAPALLDAAGLGEEAQRMRGLEPIEGVEQALAVLPDLRAVRLFTEAAMYGAHPDTLLNVHYRGVGAQVARADEGSGSVAARNAVLGVDGEEGGALLVARSIVADAAALIAWTSPNNPWAALGPIVDALRESAFALLGRMLDPAGIHDVPEAADLGQEAPQGEAFPNPREEVKT